VVGLLGLLMTSTAWPVQNPVGDSAGSRVLTAVRFKPDERIKLDGRPDEKWWSRVTPASDFRQSDPTEGAPASERTEVYVAYTPTDLYIGAWFHDSDPSGILAYQKERDASIGTDDGFTWMLDTFRDGRSGYYFGINPAGLMLDGLLASSGQINLSWDGIWEARTARGPEGWSAEIRIPFRTLNFDPSRDAWGIDFQRTIRRKNEDVLWSGYGRSQGLHRPLYGGQLRGLRDLSQGIGLEAIPYLTGNWQRNPAGPGSADLSPDFGLDLQYSLTPSLRAAVTVNTDFAEVEVDERRVNLTRFPLFFPERRDFFLEGSGVYGFGARNGMTPFFSREIGLVNGTPVPIRYGARLGGKVGRYEVGVMQVHTGGDERFDPNGSPVMVPSEDFSLARVKRTLFGQSSLGLIYTRRATAAVVGGAAPPDRHTVGFDLELSTTRFLGSKPLQLEAFAIANTDPVGGGFRNVGNRSAHGVAISFPDKVLTAGISYRELGDDYAPAVGFTPRNGFRRFQSGASVHTYPRWLPGVRHFWFGGDVEYLANLENRLETRNVIIRPLAMELGGGDLVLFEVRNQFERLDDPFQIRPNIVIPVGDYNTLGWQLLVQTAGRRTVSSRLTVEGGEFWSGKRTGYDARLAIKPYPGITLTTQVQHNRVNLAEGDFATNVFRLGGGWHLSPRVSFIGTAQYDDVSEIVGLFTRFRLIAAPGNDIYFVYTHNWQDAGRRVLDFDYRTISQGAAAKISFTQRF
jgi:hypothetical protein